MINYAGNKNFALIWNNPNKAPIIGEAHKVAQKFFRSKGMKLRLINISGKLLYFIRFQDSNSWIKGRFIPDSLNANLNRQNAFADYFYNFLLTNQHGFSISQF